MFWLGLALPIAYIPGYVGVSIPTQWAVLSVALLPSLWRHSDLRAPHWIGLSFLSFAALSMLWAPGFGFELWIACIWGLSFWYGWTSYGFLTLWKGLAVGIWINSAVAILQALGYEPVLMNGPAQAGLLFNSAVLSSVAALVTVAMICHEQWKYLPGLYPALWFAHSRGAWMIVILALVAKYIHWSVAVALLVFVGAMVFLSHTDSDLMRFQIWSIAASNLTWLGNGVGSFNSVYMWYKDAAFHPEYAHNDYLQMVFEFGVAGLVPIGLLAAALYGTGAKDWIVLFSFAVLALFYFPFWTPITAFIGCAVAGHILRYYGHEFSMFDRGRYGVIPRRENWEFEPDPLGWRHLSDFEGITNKAMRETR